MRGEASLDPRPRFLDDLAPGGMGLTQRLKPGPVTRRDARDAAICEAGNRRREQLAQAQLIPQITVQADRVALPVRACISSSLELEIAGAVRGGTGLFIDEILHDCTSQALRALRDCGEDVGVVHFESLRWDE